MPPIFERPSRWVSPEKFEEFMTRTEPKPDQKKPKKKPEPKDTEYATQMSVKERQLRDEVFERGDEIDKLRAEIERLRAALQRLVSDIDEGEPRDEGYDMACEALK